MIVTILINYGGLVVSFQARHVVLLLCQYVNHLEVVRLPVYRPTQKECSDPKLYANNVRRLMAAEVRLLLICDFLQSSEHVNKPLVGMITLIIGAF